MMKGMRTFFLIFAPAVSIVLFALILRMPDTKRFLPLYEKSCASCHGNMDLRVANTNFVEPQWWWFDLTEPAESPALTAHLPVKEGGRGYAAKGRFSFSSRQDALWTELLDIAKEAANEAWRTPEADMPGFVPRSRGRCEYRP